MPKPLERTALYRLYDSEGQLLYIGITTNPKVRFASHATYKHWWNRVARKDVSWGQGTWREALAAEAAAIRDEMPEFNSKHNAQTAPISPCAWSPIEAPPRGKAAALADLIRTEIQVGRWTSGMRVPRRADIARASGVSEGTADLAYRTLEKEGLLQIRHGRGTFVAQ